MKLKHESQTQAPGEFDHIKCFEQAGNSPVCVNGGRVIQKDGSRIDGSSTNCRLRDVSGSLKPENLSVWEKAEVTSRAASRSELGRQR